jgi:hypothetical protein
MRDLTCEETVKALLTWRDRRGLLDHHHPALQILSATVE